MVLDMGVFRFSLVNLIFFCLFFDYFLFARTNVF